MSFLSTKSLFINNSNLSSWKFRIKFTTHESPHDCVLKTHYGNLVRFLELLVMDILNFPTLPFGAIIKKKLTIKKKLMPNLFGCYNVRICDNLFIWDKDMKFFWRSLSFYLNDMQKIIGCNFLRFFLLKYK